MNEEEIPVESNNVIIDIETVKRLHLLHADENTLASNNFESIDRITPSTHRCDYGALRGLWRMYYLVISIKNKIHDYLFVDVYGIDREESDWSNMYGNSPLKGIIDQLSLIKAQEKYMKGYYKLSEEKE